MNMVIPDEGKELWLKWALTSDGSDLEDFTLELYKNDYTPVDGSTQADFSASTFTGYASEPVARADFGAPAIVGHIAYALLGFVPTYTCTGGSPELAYGWFMFSNISEKVVAAQRFDNPRAMASGATETLDPFRIALQTFH
jgi:hypothetical protein